MVELNADQRHILQERPPRILDPQTHTAYVLVRADVYDRLKSLLTEDEDQDVQDLYPLLADIEPNDWEDAANYDGQQ